MSTTSLDTLCPRFGVARMAFTAAMKSRVHLARNGAPSRIRVSADAATVEMECSPAYTDAAERLDRVVSEYHRGVVALASEDLDALVRADHHFRRAYEIACGFQPVPS